MKKGIAAVALLGVALAPMLGKAASAGLVFTYSTAEQAVVSGEPSIAVDPTHANQVYYIAPGMTNLAVSTNGGATFVLRSAVQTNGDSDVAVDQAGNVYVSALLGGSGALTTTIPMTTLSNDGKHVLHTLDLYPASANLECDRQWTAASQAGHVVTTARCGSIIKSWVSTNTGASFTGPFTVATGVTRGGPITFSPDGSTLWAAYQVSTGVRWAKSLDGGTTWTTGAVKTASCCTLFPVMDIDAANNLYVVWSTTAQQVQFTKSTNGGTTWSTISTLSDPTPSAVLGDTTSAIFPWVTAGAAGKIDVSWYQARQVAGGSETDLGSDLGLPTTQWDVITAQSLNANSATPTWTFDTAVTDFHDGSVCTSGLSCVGPQNAGIGNVPTPYDRRDLDFFESAMDSTGHLLIAYPHDRAVTGGNLLDPIQSQSDMKVAHQTAGPPIN